jgi:hypothetical protein
MTYPKPRLYFSSNILKLKIYWHYYPVFGDNDGNFWKPNKPKWFLIPDINELEIKLEGFNRNLTFEQLERYIHICMESQNKEKSSWAAFFHNDFMLAFGYDIRADERT